MSEKPNPPEKKHKTEHPQKNVATPKPRKRLNGSSDADIPKETLQSTSNGPVF